VIPPGTTTTLALPLAPLHVSVTTLTGINLAGYRVVATPSDPTGCDTTETSMALGITGGGGDIKSSLPGGVWNLQVLDPAGNPKTLDNGNATEPTVPLVAGSPAVDQILRVA
jgi:hypothetical protein